MGAVSQSAPLIRLRNTNCCCLQGGKAPPSPTQYIEPAMVRQRERPMSTPVQTTISQTTATVRPATKPQQKADWRRLFSLREMGVYYALLLLVIVLSVVTTYLGRGNYLSFLNLTNVMYQASLTAIMAVAMTVILISGNFDLSVASVAALSAAVLVGTADLVGFWPAVALAMGVAIAAGLLNGSIVQFVGINAFI